MKRVGKVWIDLRNAGMTLQAIADADGTASHETIRATFKNLKVQTPAKTKVINCLLSKQSKQ
jgi:hypothetical protein